MTNNFTPKQIWTGTYHIKNIASSRYTEYQYRIVQIHPDRKPTSFVVETTDGVDSLGHVNWAAVKESSEHELAAWQDFALCMFYKNEDTDSLPDWSSDKGVFT